MYFFTTNEDSKESAINSRPYFRCSLVCRPVCLESERSSPSFVSTSFEVGLWLLSPAVAVRLHPHSSFLNNVNHFSEGAPFFKETPLLASAQRYVKSVRLVSLLK